MKRRDFIARALSGLAAVTGLAIAAAPALLASRSPSYPPGSPYPNYPYPPDPEPVALAAGQPAKAEAAKAEEERVIALAEGPVKEFAGSNIPIDFFEQENIPGVYENNFVFDEVPEYTKYFEEVVKVPYPYYIPANYTLPPNPIMNTGDTDPLRTYRWGQMNATLDNTTSAASRLTTAAEEATASVKSLTDTLNDAMKSTHYMPNVNA